MAIQSKAFITGLPMQHPVAVDHRYFAGKQNINYFGNPKYHFTSKVLMAQMHNFVLWLTCPRYRWNVDLIQCCICQYSHINLLSPEPWLSSPTRIERRQNPHQKHITWLNQQLTMIELTEWDHHGYRYECYTHLLQISLHSMNGFPHNIHIVGCEHIQQCEHIKKKKQTIL